MNYLRLGNIILVSYKGKLIAKEIFPFNITNGGLLFIP